MPWSWWRRCALRAADAEGHAPVHRGVGHGRRQQGEQRWRPARACPCAAPRRAARRPAVLTTPTTEKRANWATRPGRACTACSAAVDSSSVVEGQAPGDEAPRPRRATPLQVVEGGGDDVDARVGVVDPVHRDLVDAHAGSLGQEQELGVEEPPRVLDQRQQGPGPVGPDRLEPALGVGEAGGQGGAEQEVVAARDDLAFGAAHHRGLRGQARADGHVAVARHQRRHQGQHGGKIGGEVDVHVGEHRRVARAPTLGAGPARVLSRRGARPPTSESSPFERTGDAPRAVGAGVVGHGDPEAEGQRCRSDSACSLRTLASRSPSSLWTGMTMSTWGALGPSVDRRSAGAPRPQPRAGTRRGRFHRGSEGRRLEHGPSVLIATVGPVNATCGFPDNPRHETPPPITAAMPARVVTVFQLRVVATTPRLRSKKALLSFVRP